MACAIFVVVAVVIVILAVNGASGSHPSLARSGRPARGILLEVSSLATRVPGGARTPSATNYPVERRQCLIEVELPGQAPVEVRTTLLVPLNLSGLVLPGATVELRVHQKNLKQIAVVGPGSGFAFGGLIPAAAPAPALPNVSGRSS